MKCFGRKKEKHSTINHSTINHSTNNSTDKSTFVELVNDIRNESLGDKNESLGDEFIGDKNESLGDKSHGDVNEVERQRSENVNDKNTKAYKNARALLVGINYTGTNNALQGCINDVKNVYTYLTQVEKYDPAQILILTDESFTPLNRQPTRKNIISGIRWLIGNSPTATQPITLVMQYSGHGTYVPDLNRDENDGRDEAICPLDFESSDFIIDDELRNELLAPVKDNSNVSVIGIFDSCHSGTIVDARYTVNILKPHKIRSSTIQSPQIKPPNIQTNIVFKPKTEFRIEESRQYPVTKCRSVIFSGCKDSQTSADAYIENKNQGMLTYAFLQTLRKNPRPSYLTFIKELQDFATKNKYTQTPQLTFGNFENINGTFSF